MANVLVFTELHDGHVKPVTLEILGKLAGQAFRIGHLGMLSESQALSGLAVIEMAMRDLDYPIVSGSGVAAAQEWYRSALNADAMRPVITAATCEDVA